MPALSGLVSVTVDQATKAIGSRGRRRFNATIVVGDGTNTYVTGGIPLVVGSKTVAQTFGLPRRLQVLNIIGSAGTPPVMGALFDATNQTLRLMHPTQQTGGAGNRDGVEYTNAEAPPASTFYAMIEGI